MPKVLATERGRARDYELLGVVRRGAAVRIVTGIGYLRRHVDTKMNLSDYHSRELPRAAPTDPHDAHLRHSCRVRRSSVSQLCDAVPPSWKLDPLRASAAVGDAVAEPIVVPKRIPKCSPKPHIPTQFERRQPTVRPAVSPDADDQRRRLGNAFWRSSQVLTGSSPSAHERQDYTLPPPSTCSMEATTTSSIVARCERTARGFLVDATGMCTLPCPAPIGALRNRRRADEINQDVSSHASVSNSCVSAYSSVYRIRWRTTRGVGFGPGGLWCGNCFVLVAALPSSICVAMTLPCKSRRKSTATSWTLRAYPPSAPATGAMLSSEGNSSARGHRRNGKRRLQPLILLPWLALLPLCCCVPLLRRPSSALAIWTPPRGGESAAQKPQALTSNGSRLSSLLPAPAWGTRTASRTRGAVRPSQTTSLPFRDRVL